MYEELRLKHSELIASIDWEASEELEDNEDAEKEVEDEYEADGDDSPGELAEFGPQLASQFSAADDAGLGIWLGARRTARCREP